MLGEAEQTYTVAEGLNSEDSVDFYAHFQFQVRIPGASTLKVALKHKSMLRLDGYTVGEFMIDLEDRWIMLQQRTIRVASNEAFLKKHVSPHTTKRIRPVKFNAHGKPRWNWKSA